MTTVNNPDPEDRRRYVQVALVLKGRISSGELARGATMPSTRGIKAEFGVSIETAQKSLRILADEGLIKRWPGLGYYVILRLANCCSMGHVVMFAIA